MTPRLRQSLLVRVFTTPSPNGLPRATYRLHDLKTGNEVELTSWEELRAYLEHRWPRRLR
ncbi:hypothetical protein [Meiothermus granaticius]|uniref:Uncharacterized protein n=1 Tax=Meiothermus granaticius NBRC 107808 TaxID=1227551 RepID=A0A399F5M9_9DEIN|nr:hypothetical protein [Meiothermus granaticius]RIH91055.1 hypothetical protein Mgrana_03053 [Meiothermus granaticius NBRC 107808]GEM86511.1 hypothetical protein MGR01S_11360 [Meiothermus granaticius NBRC 107808]